MTPRGLEETVRLVYLQFSFNNESLIPMSLRTLPDETFRQHVERKTRGVSGNGEQLLAPVENNLGIEEAAKEMLSHPEYTLVDVQHQIRLGGVKGVYHMLRFVFARNKHALPNPNINLEEAKNILRRICREAMWRVRIFMNPYAKEGMVGEEFMLSINLEARNPLFDGKTGEHLMVWKKDENGERIAGSKAPLHPTQVLHIGDTIYLSAI